MRRELRGGGRGDPAWHSRYNSYPEPSNEKCRQPRTTVLTRQEAFPGHVRGAVWPLSVFVGFLPPGRRLPGLSGKCTLTNTYKAHRAAGLHPDVTWKLHKPGGPRPLCSLTHGEVAGSRCTWCGCACKPERPGREHTETPTLFTSNLCLLCLSVFVRFSSLSVSFFLNEKTVTCFLKAFLFSTSDCMQIPRAWGKTRGPQGPGAAGLWPLRPRAWGQSVPWLPLGWGKGQGVPDKVSCRKPLPPRLPGLPHLLKALPCVPETGSSPPKPALRPLIPLQRQQVISAHNPLRSTCI